MPDERTGVIYIATINQDKSYVGMTLDFPKRKKGHLKCNRTSPFHEAIRKYGADSIEWRILEDNIPQSRLSDREVLWIAFYDTYYNGYNATEGGSANPMDNPESRKKISDALKARVARGEHNTQDPESRARMSETAKAKAARGEHQSQNPKVRSKMSKTHKERHRRGEHQMQDPKVVSKMIATRSVNKVKKRFKDRVEAGQSFLFDMDLDNED